MTGAVQSRLELSAVQHSAVASRHRLTVQSNVQLTHHGGGRRAGQDGGNSGARPDIAGTADIEHSEGLQRIVDSAGIVSPGLR